VQAQQQSNQPATAGVRRALPAVAEQRGLVAARASERVGQPRHIAVISTFVHLAGQGQHFSGEPPGLDRDGPERVAENVAEEVGGKIAVRVTGVDGERLSEGERRINPAADEESRPRRFRRGKGEVSVLPVAPPVVDGTGRATSRGSSRFFS